MGWGRDPPAREKHALARHACGMLTAAVVAVTVSSASTAGAPPRGAYGWPMKPFLRQHVVRGYFGDPRIGPSRFTGRIEHNFHIGIDIVTLDGAPIFSVTTGVVALRPEQPNLVRVVSRDTVLEYWHVIPAVRDGQTATAYRTVVGHVQASFRHVNLSEWRRAGYVNPLRPGALSPYIDRTTPRIGDVRVERFGHALTGPVGGVVDIVVGAVDMPAMPVPDPEWKAFPVTPAFVRWRTLTSDNRPMSDWRTAYDVRYSLPVVPFSEIYARGTRQNRPNSRGWYRFYLARGWDSHGLPDGTYVIEVAASDTRGNRVVERQSLTIRNAA